MSAYWAMAAVLQTHPIEYCESLNKGVLLETTDENSVEI